jgi:hypothetical protein
MHRSLTKALHHLQLSTAHPVFGPAICAHRHQQPVKTLVIPLGIAKKGAFQRRQELPVEAPLSAVERIITACGQQQAEALMPRVPLNVLPKAGRPT